MIDGFTPAFKKGTDVWMLFNHILDVVFSGIIKVLRDESLDNADNIEMVYGLLYLSIKPYFSWETEVALRHHINAGQA